MYLGTKLLNNPIQKVKKWNFREFFWWLVEVQKKNRRHNCAADSVSKCIKRKRLLIILLCVFCLRGKLRQGQGGLPRRCRAGRVRCLPSRGREVQVP